MTSPSRALPSLHTATGRFVLSPFSSDDVEPLAHLLANDDIWATGFGDGHHRPDTHEEMVRFIDRRHEGLRIFAVHYTGLPGGPLLVGRVECDVDPRNRRSLSSLKRFGFTVEGTRRRSSRRNDGSWRDIVVLSLLTEEWPATRERALLALAEMRNFPLYL